ncbi:cask-interacting protein (caskin) 1,2 [Histomonas meleagridis]|uniref:cask-interacting protein (caskin) n=1 Tax=Histomonas meleagridis TaxID=135588 RepID=UPI00355956E9|nr:cask-interacting protein (caskin) 1,2 [Histomonas meleagridis]KAH0801200.1 cask-interacting protein (caskin) [Histomonas meleagridis]
MILQGLIDTDFVQKIRTFYFQQYRPNQDLLFFPFYQEFRENYNKLSANDWKLQKELTNEGVNPSELVKVLREDDIQKLQEMSTQPNFDFNQCIEPSLYEKNSIINEANVTLIECCAFLGAIKCFKFLLMNGAKVENAGKYAVAGGNNEIIRLCEQNNSTFRGAFEKAIEYNRKEIFHYLFDSQIEDLNENKGIPQLDDNMQQIQNNLAKISSSLANALPGFDPTMFANLGNQQNLQQHPKVEEETNHESFFGKLFGSHKNELEPPQNEGEKDEAEYESFFNKLFGSNKNDTNEPEKEGDHETFFSKLFGSHQDDKDKPNEDEGDEGELNPGAFFGKLFGDIKSMFELLGDSENGENNNKENEKQNEDNKENVKEETQGENIENEKQNENDNKENVEKQNEKNEDNKENENNDEKDEKPNDNNKEDSLSPIKDNFTLDNMKKLLTLCIFYNNYELLSFLLTKGDFIDDKILNEVANCGDIFLFKCFSEKVPYSKKILTEVIFSGNPEFFSYIMKQDGFSIEKMYKGLFIIYIF